jgi:RimJ/RimL family protein N-acetyltransferase
MNCCYKSKPVVSFGQYQIRPWAERDVVSLQRFANNRNVWLNLRDIFPHPYTLKDAEDWIGFVLTETPIRSFAVASEKEAIGGIGLEFGMDVHSQTAELGYWLAEPYWGRGIMTNAVSCYTEFSLQHYDLLRIFAEPYANNYASRRVLEKSGYILEGIKRMSVIKDGKVLDQALYGVIRDGSNWIICSQ